MTRAADDDVYALTQRLAEECENAGLDAVVVAPTRVRVSRPGPHGWLSQIVRCMPDRDERLMWWLNWSEPICPAARISEAVRAIARAFTAPVTPKRPPTP